MALGEFRKITELVNRIQGQLDYLKSKESEDIIVYKISMLIEDVDYSDVKRFVEAFPDKAQIAHEAALQIVGRDLEKALKEAIGAAVWDWKGETRDIVDTGALRRTMKVIVEGSEMRCYSDREYAALVHYGGYFHPYGNPRIRLYYPARPWIEAVVLGGGPVDRFDFAASYQPRFARQLRKLIKD